MSENTDGASDQPVPPEVQSPPGQLPRSQRLTDPRALRAYAHPTRMRLVGLLRTQGPCTATRAAELTGESVASCSYHLRMLAKYGLVEVAAGGQGREKPWRATASATEWPHASEDPAVSEAAEAVEAVVADRYAELLRHAVATRRSLPGEWQQAVRIGDTLLYLTAAELSDIHGRIDALLHPFEERAARPEVRPAGARLVQVIEAAFPLSPEPSSGREVEASEAARTGGAAAAEEGGEAPTRARRRTRPAPARPDGNEEGKEA
ncbi:helix-turn-helix domain-containing protein [Streptomyces sp. 796.1]|uniref:helix-turn-helix domain-containing protein n=1 Tax=Streptomyces sp. 796.1 TaxID=3163029 RepID=UPI0039C97966